ncbi:hypothetical protein BDZ89DRAFT_961982 [Hymenopellis radicata]|nr:hypothetical protein BDZ89DRAFT_961982 [Hymenopellis radicata]
MPTTTERQQVTQALLEAFLVSLIAEAQEDLLQALDSDSSSSSDGSSSSSSDGLSSSSSDGSTFDFMDCNDIDVEDDIETRESTILLESLAAIHSERYLHGRDERITKSASQLDLLLTDWKFNRPEIFRSFVRMSPDAFDSLLDTIRHHEAFHNNSNHEQMPVERQLAITLYRFGHFGNAASQLKVALWAGIGYGTVALCTVRVMRAVCSEEFRRSAVRWPTASDKEAAKQWTEDHSCPAWRHGWLMVDGSLIPLYARPGLYGNVYFDRKSNYSINLQVVNLPDLRIVDFSLGLPGSQHDATAWMDTRVYKEHEQLFEEGEWIWADSAYPLRDWCQAPYKAYDFPSLSQRSNLI